jgi:ATP-binding cassette subfamily B protein
LAFVKWHYSNKTNQLERKNVGLERQSNFLNWVLTSLEYAKEVRVFDFGMGYLSKFKKIRSRISNEKKRIGYQNAWAGFWAQLIEIVSICYIYFKIAIQTFTGVLSIGSFVLYFQAFQRLQTSLKSFLDSLVQLFQLRSFLNDLFIFLDLPEYEKQKSEVLLNPGKGINITQLSFSYPRSNKKALKNISLHCKPGSLIALVGENGSGKSTLVKLLTGLYHVEDEAINIYGVPVNKIPENQLRKKISVIFQDFNMYDATVTENIGLDLVVNNERIIDSAKATGADRFIKNFPLGYDTLLGTLFKKSEQLSGGQWQKLAISRALYRNSEIIILDEPTSHVDPIAESDIIENLKNNISDKIIILITHRLYNLKKADFIYAMHQGEIIEQGTFKELIVKEGLFKRMFEKQKL